MMHVHDCAQRTIWLICIIVRNRAQPCVMFCSTLVQCSSSLCLSWTSLSTKMHSHMFPLPKDALQDDETLPSSDNEEERGVPPAAKRQKVSSSRIPLVCNPLVSSSKCVFPAIALPTSVLNRPFNPDQGCDTQTRPLYASASRTPVAF